MRFARALVVAAAGLTAYSLYEPFRYHLQIRRLELAGISSGLSVLHLSDPHTASGDRRLQKFLRELPRKLPDVPDLVLATGDLIEGDEGIEPAVDALEGLDARLGKFYVLGSHDYYISKFRLPTKYFSNSRTPAKARRAATERLEDRLRSNGWVALTNATELVDAPAGKIRLAGVDDPYIKRHKTDHIARARGEILAIGLVHAPDVVSEWFLHGFDLVLAGHTHAGQVRLPWVGAVVTNSSLPTGLATGLHRVGNGWLHVSPGLGTGRFTPIRLGARPEVTLLEIAPVTP